MHPGITCPLCGSPHWKCIRNPVDPAQDKFRCSACHNNWSRYGEASLGRMFQMDYFWRRDQVWIATGQFGQLVWSCCQSPPVVPQ